MPSCIFDTCCGCIELKTGCLIIGYLNLIGEIIMIIFSSLVLIGGGVVASSDDHKQQQVGVAAVVIAVILLLIFFFFFAFTIVLLVGIHKNKRGHVKAFLIMATILLVLGAITTLAGLSQGFDAKDFVYKIVTYLLNIYFLLVIRSYYYKMEEKRPAIYSAGP